MNISKEKGATTSTVAKINNVEIVVIENGEKRLAVRPICDALGVAYQSQIERLKNDPLIGSTVTLSMTVGADGKEREMVTIPFKYVFGWLFMIDSRNVKPEAAEAVLRYQKECYDALYDHFERQSEFLKQRQDAIDAQIEKNNALRSSFKDAERLHHEGQAELERIRKVTFEQWKADQGQLKLFTTEEMEG